MYCFCSEIQKKQFLICKITCSFLKILQQVDKIESLSTEWLNAAKGSFGRAAASLATDIRNSDLDDIEMCRILNNRIMRVMVFSWLF